jgi:hypothetical protein
MLIAIVSRPSRQSKLRSLVGPAVLKSNARKPCKRARIVGDGRRGLRISIQFFLLSYPGLLLRFLFLLLRYPRLLSRDL